MSRRTTDPDEPYTEAYRQGAIDERAGWEAENLRLRALLQDILNANDIGTPKALGEALNAAHLHLVGRGAP